MSLLLLSFGSAGAIREIGVYVRRAHIEAININLTNNSMKPKAAICGAPEQYDGNLVIRKCRHFAGREWRVEDL